MSGIYSPGMKMPTTGLYFVGVDNANGRDKTVVTVERMLGNRDIRQIVGSFELVPVPDHGRLIDADALCKTLRSLAENEYTPEVFANWIESHIDTIIPAEEGEE